MDRQEQRCVSSSALSQGTSDTSSETMWPLSMSHSLQQKDRSSSGWLPFQRPVLRSSWTQSYLLELLPSVWLALCPHTSGSPWQLLGVLVAKSCLTRCDPVDCSPPGSPVFGILQAKYWSGSHALLQQIFRIQGLNPGLLHGRPFLSPGTHGYLVPVTSMESLKADGCEAE